MTWNMTTYLLLLVLLAFCLSDNGVYAFGAGNIPSFAFMEDKAFRHGDIEDVLKDLAKQVGGAFLGSLIGKGSKFNGLDIKRVYFGNWLRDYSQAVDIASLKKVPLQTIINLCMVLGFLAHGYVTNEFEVTPERLGCYLPTEHIDNPKGYGDGEDPRKYHAGLRGPVDPRELEIDPRTGMKNYIANENGPWDTSKALVRRTLGRCIELGRRHRTSNQKADLYEAYRLLGQALHTLEDFPAHSNFCELALVKLGYHDVFLHVGDNVRIQAPGGKWVAPIVTGSFGSSDFLHSLLGEASDHLSEASVTDLNRELDKARSKSIQQSTRSGPGGAPSDPASVLRELFTSIPGEDGNDMARDLATCEKIRAGPAAGGKRPEDMSPQELHAVLWQVLTFRDSVAKKISKTIEKIPGLGPMIEKLQDAISVFVLTTLEPFLKPILKSTTSGLAVVSGEVIDSHDQYEVFNDPRASDPTHSFLSKDHFNLILNEPAGQVAKAIVKHAVTLVVKAWDNTSMGVKEITDDILQCLFHPDFHDPRSKIQLEMLQAVNDWVKRLGGRQHTIISRLGKNAVRNHENIRSAGEGGAPAAQGSFAANQAHEFQSSIAGYASGHVPGIQSVFNATGFGRDTGTRKEGVVASGEAASFYANSHGTGPQNQYAPPSAPPPLGPGGNSDAASFYASSHGYGPHQGRYPSPSGPPPPHGPTGGGGYPAPSSAPSLLAPQQQHSGYAPSYITPPGSSPASFAGGPGSHSPQPPHGYQQQHQHQPSFPSLPGGPGFTSSFPPPSGPPPMFPGGPGNRETLPPGVGAGGFGFPTPGQPGGFGAGAGPSPPLQFPSGGPGEPSFEFPQAPGHGHRHGHGQGEPFGWGG